MRDKVPPDCQDKLQLMCVLKGCVASKLVRGAKYAATDGTPVPTYLRVSITTYNTNTIGAHSPRVTALFPFPPIVYVRHK